MNDLNSSLTEQNRIDDIFYTKKKVKCYKNKYILCGSICFCVLFFVGAIHFNIQCGSFNKMDLCDIPTYCPSHNCDGSDLI